MCKQVEGFRACFLRFYTASFIRSSILNIIALDLCLLVYHKSESRYHWTIFAGSIFRLQNYWGVDTRIFSVIIIFSAPKSDGSIFPFFRDYGPEHVLPLWEFRSVNIKKKNNLLSNSFACYHFTRIQSSTWEICINSSVSSSTVLYRFKVLHKFHTKMKAFIVLCAVICVAVNKKKFSSPNKSTPAKHQF